jgi:hypothetical protein
MLRDSCAPWRRDAPLAECLSKTPKETSRVNVVENLEACVDEFVAGDQACPEKAAAWLDDVGDDDLVLVEHWARATLDALPTPLRPSRGSELERRRTILVESLSRSAGYHDSLWSHALEPHGTEFLGQQGHGFRVARLGGHTEGVEQRGADRMPDSTIGRFVTLRISVPQPWPLMITMCFKTRQF